jgi:hypothetical protein
MAASQDQHETEHHVDDISVHISYEIIRLFSEGLYQSPHKAIEELVSNSYDAGATRVRILLPDPGDGNLDDKTLWVVDNGHGMGTEGFHHLWQVAESVKGSEDGKTTGRPPIGQFGIGKLAAYVLASELIHYSRAEEDGIIRSTHMDFRHIEGRSHFHDSGPLTLSLKEVSEARAQELLRELSEQDAEAWDMLFGPNSSPTWTVAGMRNFKNLYYKIATGRLGWVLKTGLPLHSNFAISLNNSNLEPSKASEEKIDSVVIGSDKDQAATDLELSKGNTSSGESCVWIPDIGEVTGEADIFQERLTKGKSGKVGRSNGFFIAVRGRIINLEDELFGLSTLNHAAWSRFAMRIDADGLRDHLLSSREGVRENEATRTLREYLLRVFNICRSAYEDWSSSGFPKTDVAASLNHAPSLFVTEPLAHGVRQATDTGQDSFYIQSVQLGSESEVGDDLSDIIEQLQNKPFEDIRFQSTGTNDRATTYIPQDRKLIVNTDHPYIQKLMSVARDEKGTATLFSSAEVLLDALLQDEGVDSERVATVLEDRDRVLRLLAGERPSTAKEVLTLLHEALSDYSVMERATGLGFRVLGFKYERRGGNHGGPDGVLFASIGRQPAGLGDYKVVYDAKQTNQPSVPASEIDFGALDTFRREEGGDFGFFIAAQYPGDNNPNSRLNSRLEQARNQGYGDVLCLLTVDHLKRLLQLHYKAGITLTTLRRVCEEGFAVSETDAVISRLEEELGAADETVPLRGLLETIESLKEDNVAVPHVDGARRLDARLKPFGVDRLTTSLQALQTIVGPRWVEVTNSGEVILHARAEQIVTEVERNMRAMEGIDATFHSDIK